ncbi:MAG: hypothetical protein AAGH76_18200 [Pseudomonadota bacterium]
MSDRTTQPAASDHTVAICNGNIYIDAPLYRRYFSGIDSVAVLAKDGDIALMPIHNSGAGGLMLKIRNADGDRVVHAREALEFAGVAESQELRTVPAWDSDIAALRIPMTG